ncbi:MAG TPA: sulfite exporter TauE/SafE family protein [Pirellulales bacterium]|nr:sulfite exporter TauE/SafE family protein [Pirellulales bacterium]
MIELPLIFVSGILGSSHCLGMCGPLALALGSNGQLMSRNLVRQLVYSLGRIFTYGFAGAAAGFFGLWLQHFSPLVNVQAGLAIACGLLLVVLGLVTAGVIPWRPTAVGHFPCAAAGWLKTLLTAPSLPQVFLAGVFTGFIPCGLVYAFVALAASTGNVFNGALTMIAFGLGTVPLMVLAGCGGSLLGIAARTRILRIAAWCVVIAGTVSIARGVGFLELTGAGTAACPFCR